MVIVIVVMVIVVIVVIAVMVMVVAAPSWCTGSRALSPVWLVMYRGDLQALEIWGQVMEH